MSALWRVLLTILMESCYVELIGIARRTAHSLYEVIWYPLHAAMVAVPMWKLWLEKFAAMLAEAIQVQKRGCPFCNRNRGPKRMPANNNVDEAALPKWIGLQALDL